MKNELVPSQEKGKSVDLNEQVSASTEVEAHQIFANAKRKLSCPILWHDLTGILSATFQVESNDPQREVKKGDHIRISIPGPGLSEGDGVDWVRVEAVQENIDKAFDESFGLMLRVSQNPHSPGDAIAHFFAEGASSSFILTRKERLVEAIYKGRNETPNTQDLPLTDKVRNIVVAGGALAGVSELQWSALLKGLLGLK